MLAHHPDFLAIRQRFHAWWAGQLDDFMLAVKAPLPAVAPPPLPPADPQARWTDLSWMDVRNDFEIRHTFYGGDALPVWTPGNASWSYLAAMLGARVVFTPESVWDEPILAEGNLADYDLAALRVREDNPWWQKTLAMQTHAVEASHGIAVPALTNYRASGDVLAGLRSSMTLTLDLVDDPATVRAWDAAIVDEWIRLNDRLIDLRLSGGHGYAIDWMSVWSDRRMHPVQNDFAGMISTAMFEDIFLENILRQIRSLEHVLYHVDGPDAFRHLDVLVAIAQIDAIQLHPGAGQPSALHFPKALHKVQRAGKALHLTLPAAEVATALATLEHRGLFLQVFCADLAEARAVLEIAERARRNRKPRCTAGGAL